MQIEQRKCQTSTVSVYITILHIGYIVKQMQWKIKETFIISFTNFYTCK